MVVPDDRFERAHARRVETAGVVKELEKAYFFVDRFGLASADK